MGWALLEDWLFLTGILLDDECRFVLERSLTQRLAMLTGREELSNEVGRIPVSL